MTLVSPSVQPDAIANPPSPTIAQRSRREMSYRPSARFIATTEHLHGLVVRDPILTARVQETTAKHLLNESCADPDRRSGARSAWSVRAGAVAGEVHLCPMRERLDKLMVDRGLAASRDRARALVMSGAVLVAGQPMTKPGTLVDPAAEIVLRESDHPY